MKGGARFERVSAALYSLNLICLWILTSGFSLAVKIKGLELGRTEVDCYYQKVYIDQVVVRILG